tara:strand:+ start:464 stop:685 length:222 start_codon:yes stop_codon:yes gene_type:complete
MQNRIQLSMILYLIFMGIVISIKPKHIYNTDGSLKQFGTGTEKTLFPLWFIIFIGAFLSYYITHIILFLFKKD